MAIFSGIAGRIRNVLFRDKDNAAKQISQGISGSRLPLAGYDMLSSYGYDAVGEFLRLEHDLVSKYLDYEAMDEMGEVSRALDVISDDATQPETSKNRTVWVTSDNKDLATLLDNLYYKRIRVDDDIWSDTRELCKYGNKFKELLVTQDGVIGASSLPPATMRRVEGMRGELHGFVQDFRPRSGTPITQEMFDVLLKNRQNGETAKKTEAARYNAVPEPVAFEDWEVVHMRLQGKYPNSLYGSSVLDPARWIWKRLMLLEDSALIYRLQRAPEKMAFYVNTGDRPPEEALAFVNVVRQMYRKKKYIDPSTGKLNLKMDALSPMDDYFIPVDKDGRESTRIEPIASPAYNFVDDLDYFLNKLFTALGVPKAYLSQDADVNRAVLSGIDVQFARSVLRVQKEIKSGLNKVARVHLAAVGIDPYEFDYEIHMTTPSSIFELAQIEVLNARADLATRMQEHVSLRWLLSNVYHLADDDIQQILKERKQETKETYGAEAEGQVVAQEINPIPPEGAPGAPGGGAPPTAGGLPVRPMPAQVPYSPSAENKTKSASKRDLYENNRYLENKLDKKFEAMMKGQKRGDKLMLARLSELGALLHELRPVRNSQ